MQGPGFNLQQQWRKNIYSHLIFCDLFIQTSQSLNHNQMITYLQTKKTTEQDKSKTHECQAVRTRKCHHKLYQVLVTYRAAGIQY